MKYLLFFFFIFTNLLIQAQQNTHMNFQTRMLVENYPNAHQVTIFIRGEVAPILRFLKQKKHPVKSSFANLVWATVTIETIRQLDQQNFVEGFEFQWEPINYFSDTMRLRNNVDSVHAAHNPLPYRVTGSGVLGAVLDTGLDMEHKDFRNPDLTTRVKKIWDQTLGLNAGYPPPAGMLYGQEFDSLDIDSGPIAHVDDGFHGTEVSGVMLGNGLHANGNAGVATGCDILVVEMDFSGAKLTSIPDAFKYAYDQADSLEKSCVINASFGGYTGSHDGLDATSLFLDSLLTEKSGRLFVAATGNSGNAPPYHIRHQVNMDTNSTAFQLNGATSSGPSVFLDIWADSNDLANLEFSIGAELPSNRSSRGHTAFKNIFSDGIIGTLVEDSITNNGNLLANVSMYAEKRGQQYNLQVFVNNPDSLYYYSLITTGQGHLDLWSASWMQYVSGGQSIYFSNTLAPPVGSTFPSPSTYVIADTLQTIASGFNCSPNVLSVGNYANRQQHTDYFGTLRTLSDRVNVLHKSSSTGPDRLGRIKPDVTATGHYTMAAAPIWILDQLISQSNVSKIDYTGAHYRNGGTSFAAPVAAGVGAMLLELCPQLTQAEFIRVMRTTAKSDEYTDEFHVPLPNTGYGYGKVDAFRTLVSRMITPTITGDLQFCEGDATELSTDQTHAVYHWSTGDATPSVNFQDSATVSLQVEDDYGCKSDTVTVHISKIDLPTVPTIVLTGNTLQTQPADSLQWFLNGAPIIGATDTTHQAQQDGVYQVAAYNAIGCAQESDTLEVVVVALEENELNPVKVFPSPANDQITITSSNEFDRLTVYDIRGKKVMEWVGKTQEKRLDVTHWSQGWYTIRITHNAASYQTKIQIVR